MKALVVNCKRNGLGVIRSLAAAGVNVVAVDDNRLSPGLLSRFPSRRCIVSDVTRSPEAFLSDLQRIGREETDAGDRPVLFPVNDEFLLPIVREWSSLDDVFVATFATDVERLRDSLDKDRMHRIAEGAGLPTPAAIHSPCTPDELGGLGLPAIVKPVNRKSPESLQAGAFRLRHCTTREQLNDATETLRKIGVEFIAQEYIPGGDDQLYTAGVVARDGVLHGIFTGRKLRQFPPREGQCSYGESVDAPELVDLSERFVRAARFTGIAQLEFKRHDDTYYFIEINPRSWSWNSLATRVGVNLPAIACDVFTDSPPPEVVRQHPERRTWHYWDTDIVYNWILNRNVPLPTLVKQAVGADCHAFWRADDWGPAAVALADTAVNKFFRARRRSNGRSSSTEALP